MSVCLFIVSRASLHGSIHRTFFVLFCFVFVKSRLVKQLLITFFFLKRYYLTWNWVVIYLSFFFGGGGSFWRSEERNSEEASNQNEGDRCAGRARIAFFGFVFSFAQLRSKVAA